MNHFFIRQTMWIVLTGGAMAAKMPKTLCPGKTLTSAALSASPVVLQATVRWPPGTNQQPAVQESTNQQPPPAANQLWTVRVGKVWKTPPPANGSHAVWAKQTLKVNMTKTMESWEAGCKKVRKQVAYLLLLVKEEGAEDQWRAELPPARVNRKTRKLLKSLLCKVRLEIGQEKLCKDKNNCYIYCK